MRLLVTLLLAVAAAAAAPARAVAAAWVWPVPPPHAVLRGFDPPVHDWLPGHRGVDLAAAVGGAVTSAGAGTVSFAGSIAGVGVVAVRHPDGLETTYQPVAARVRRGETVAAGAVLGTLLPGGHCGAVPCLHWALRRGDTYLDPLTLVGAGPVRLLPVPGAGAGLPTAPPGLGGSLGVAAVVGCWLLRRTRRAGRSGSASRADDAASRRSRARHLPGGARRGLLERRSAVTGVD